MAEKRLTREQARELYDDLHKAMSQMMAKNGASGKIPQMGDIAGSSPDAQSKAAKEIAEAIRSGLKGKTSAAATYVGMGQKARLAAPGPKGTGSRTGNPVRVRTSTSMGGPIAAIAVMALFCCLKLVFSAIEASGVAEIKPAQAAAPIVRHDGPQWTKEEAKVLMALDHRRTELEERSVRIEQRESELAARDRDVAVRLAELKELTDKLKIDREKGEKQRGSQLDQLANVYGSMNPPEAAHLLEQLDIQVALSLIQRMPEKRMAQILALMSAQRALELTNMLSQRGVGK
jgi:flagellar motility protein MotE (MotC chaperone)